MTQLTDNFYAVPVPIWANGFKIECIPQADLYELVCYHIGVYDEPLQEKSIALPPGSYTFLFCTSEATEDQARKVVLSSQWHFPERHTRYVDYAHPYDRENRQRWSEGFGTALESLRSLLKSKGCEGECYAVIQKI